jgi:hypothetical protein
VKDADHHRYQDGPDRSRAGTDDQAGPAAVARGPETNQPGTYAGQKARPLNAAGRQLEGELAEGGRFGRVVKVDVRIIALPARLTVSAIRDESEGVARGPVLVRAIPRVYDLASRVHAVTPLDPFQFGQICGQAAGGPPMVLDIIVQPPQLQMRLPRAELD